MDPVLVAIYKTVIDAAPYVIAAYFLLWLGLIAYISFGIRKVTGLEKQIAALEESLARRGVTTAE
jgi:hypothetical protein